MRRVTVGHSYASAEDRGGVQSDFERRLARSGAVRVRSGLRGLIELLLRNPVPGKEFFEPGLRRLGDPAEHVGEPSLRIDVVELGGADEGVHRRRAHAAAVRAGEQP